MRYYYVDGWVGGDGVGGGRGVEAVDVAGIGEGPVLVFGRVGGGVDLGGVALVSWMVWICMSMGLEAGWARKQLIWKSL